MLAPSPLPPYTSLLPPPPPPSSSSPPPTSAPLHPAGFNNKTTDCVIKTTSINHKRNAYTGRPTEKNLFSHQYYKRVYNSNNNYMYVWSIVRDPSHDLYIIHIRGGALIIIGFPSTLRSLSVANWDVFFLSRRCRRCGSTLYNIIIIRTRWYYCCIQYLRHIIICTRRRGVRGRGRAEGIHLIGHAPDRYRDPKIKKYQPFSASIYNIIITWLIDVTSFRTNTITCILLRRYIYSTVRLTVFFF